MYCKHCGEKINDGVNFCPFCGGDQQPGVNLNQQQSSEDNGGSGLCLIGCCIPLLGIIFYLIWKDSKPESAKSIGTGALISIVFCLLYYFIVVGTGVGLGLGIFF